MRLAGLALVLAGCAPDLGDDASRIERARVIAVRSEPAEAAPGGAVRWTAVVASPEGPLAAPALSWSLCSAPKPLTENDTVSRACLDDPAVLVPLGEGSDLQGVVPTDACQRFGPDPPPQAPGTPPLRPRDADVTGGYYQPVRIDDGVETSFALQRITCNLGGASPAVVADFRARYTANRNPTLSAITATRSGAEVALDALPADAEIELRADFSDDSVETYPVLSLETGALVDTPEALRVSWYATAGTLALERSGRRGDEPERFTSNTFRTPTAPGPVFLWVVLRDSRGGVDTRAFTAVIR